MTRLLQGMPDRRQMDRAKWLKPQRAPSQGEVFDPSTAGSVPAGTDGTEAAGNAAAGAGSEAAADGGMAGESGGTALTAGTTADWNDPDFDDAADRLISGSTAAPQEQL